MDFIELKEWETRFSEGVNAIQPQRRAKPGALLSVVPDRPDWDKFVACVSRDWDHWNDDLSSLPTCLLILYSGLAFFEYEDGAFWPQFSRVVGKSQLSVNEQRLINGSFAAAARRMGLSLRSNRTGTDFVGSAVNMIGIPLNLWDGFLEICEWASWSEDWKAFSEAEWQDAISKRCASRQRLRRFLCDSRVTTANLIKEVLDARDIVASNPSFTISDIAQASILRPEYFDEIIETAEFLRPQDPQSLFRERARLIFDEQRYKLYLQLPGIDTKRLPAVWQVGVMEQAAAYGPDEMTLNALALSDWFQLNLKVQGSTEVQRLRGLGSWALFDMENGGCVVNSRSDELRLRSYALVSPTPIDFSVEGFDIDDDTPNVPFELSDGTKCFLTRLWPTKKFAELTIRVAGQQTKTITFRTRNRIEARFYVGWGYKSAYCFRNHDGKLGMDHLPVLSVAVPTEYFRDSGEVLRRAFRVTIDNRQADGYWQSLMATTDREYWEWQWGRQPIIEKRPGYDRLTSFAELGQAFRSADLRGDHTFAINARQYLRDQIDVFIIGRSGSDLDSCWKHLPGHLLPLFLLCQFPGGLKWEEMLVAKEIVAPTLTLNHYHLARFLHQGFIIQRGNRWFLDQSRAEFETSKKECILKYCGDPSTMWGLYRHIQKQEPVLELPIIEVYYRTRSIPYMQMTWPATVGGLVDRYLRAKGVIMGKLLWTQ